MSADLDGFEWIVMEYDIGGCLRCPEEEALKKKNVRPRASDEAAYYKQKGAKARRYRVKRLKFVPRLDADGEEVKVSRICTSCRRSARFNLSTNEMRLMIKEAAAWKRIKAHGPTAPRYYTIRDERTLTRSSIWVTQQDEDGTICNHGHHYTWDTNAWEGRVDSINNPNAVLLGEVALAAAEVFHNAALSAEGKEPVGGKNAGSEMKFTKSDSFRSSDSFGSPPRSSSPPL